MTLSLATALEIRDFSFAQAELEPQPAK